MYSFMTGPQMVVFREDDYRQAALAPAVHN